MDVQCLECSNWRPRDTDKGLAKLGFAICAIHSKGPGHTYSGGYPRECPSFTRAAIEIIDARRAVYAERVRTWPG